MNFIQRSAKKLASAHSSSQHRQQPLLQHPQSPADALDDRSNRQSRHGGSTAPTHNMRNGEEGAGEIDGQQQNQAQQPAHGVTRVVYRSNTGGQQSSVHVVPQESGLGDPNLEQLWNNADRTYVGDQSNGTGASGRQPPGGDSFPNHQTPHPGAQMGSVMPVDLSQLNREDLATIVGRLEWLIGKYPAKLQPRDASQDDLVDRVKFAVKKVDAYLHEYDRLADDYVRDTKTSTTRIDKLEAELSNTILQLQAAKSRPAPNMGTYVSKSQFETLQKERNQLRDTNDSHKRTISDQSKTINDQSHSNARLISELGALKAKHSQVVSSEEKLSREASGYNSTIHQLTERCNQWIAASNARDTIISEHKATIERLGTEVETHKGEVVYARQTLSNEMGRLRKERDEERGQLQQTHEAEKGTLRQEHEAKRRSLEQQLLSAQGEAEKRRNILVKQHEDDVKKLKSDHSAAMEGATARLQKQIATMQTDFKDNQVALEKKHKDQLASHEEDAKMYQRALTTSADSVRSLTDAELRDQLAQLKNAVEALSRAPFWEKPGPDMAALGEISGQSEIAASIPSKHRKFLLESAIWSVLMKGLFGLPVGLSGIGAPGDDLVRLWAHLFAPGSTVAWNGVNIPAPESLGEQWRSITTEALRRNVLGERATAAGSSDFRKLFQQHQATVREQLLQLLGRITTVKKPGDIDSVVERASAMAVLFGTQKSRLEMCLPSMGESPSATGYEVSFSNEADVAKAKTTIVQFGVSPGLRKWGNARGGSLETMTSLVPALVYARPA